MKEIFPKVHILDDSRPWDDQNRQNYRDRKQYFPKTTGGESGVNFSEMSFKEWLLNYAKIDHKDGSTTEYIKDFQVKNLETLRSFTFLNR